MISLIASLIFAFLAVGLFFTSFVVYGNNGRRRAQTFLSALGASAMAIIFAIIACFSIVPVSKTGVVTSMGKLQSYTLSEGPHLVAPWQSVHFVSNASSTITAPDKMVFYTQDSQKVYARISAQIQVRDKDSRKLFQLNPALNYMEQFVTPALLESFKHAVGQYPAEQLNSNLNALNETFMTQMKQKLSPRFIQVVAVNVLDWSFTPEFSKSVEDKEIEKQNVTKAEYTKQRAQKESDAVYIRAQGEAKSIREVNGAINAQGGENFIKLREIEKWNGSKATTLVNGPASPLVNIPTK